MLKTIVLHKPYGVLSRFTDLAGRSTLKQLVDLPDLYPVGRLDQDSEGLLLLTQESRVTRCLTTPGKHWKTYWAQVERVPSPEALDRLRHGLSLDGKSLLPARARLIPDPELPERSVPIRFRKTVPTRWLELELQEGRNRQVRRMTAAVGHPTLRLVRVRVGAIELGGLPAGQWRALSPQEEVWLRGLR